jgi:hypothetical protein
MLRKPLVLAGLSLVLFSSWAVGCGSDTETGGTGGGGAGGPSGPGVQPPDRPEGASAGDGDGTAFAVSELFLGDTDRNGSPNPSAWKDFGYDLDGKISTKDSSDLCKPNAGGSPSSVYPDGNDGIDNAFGKLLLPIITGLAQDASQQINESIAAGDFTIIVNIPELGDSANYDPLSAGLFAGVTLVDDMGATLTPKWDGTDLWPVAPELLATGSPGDDCQVDPCTSQVEFNQAYLTDNTFVSGSPGSLDLNLSVAGFSLNLSIAQAVISMDVAGDRSGATEGVIAGVIPVEPLISELQKIAGSFDPGLCTGTTFESLADQIRQASDIMSDGSQDPNATCDAISIGLGFNSKPVLLGTVDEPAEPQPDPCEAM